MLKLYNGDADAYLLLIHELQTGKAAPKKTTSANKSKAKKSVSKVSAV